MKNKSNWTLFFSVLAFLFSGYAVFVCDKRIEADWLGILVGILALLVTVLLGWNIYSAIQLDNIMDKKMKKARDSVSLEIRKDFICMQMKVLQGYIVNRDWYMVMEGYYFLISDVLALEDKDKAKDAISLIDVILDKIPLVEKRNIESFQKLANKIMKLSLLDESACELYNKAVKKIEEATKYNTEITNKR